MQETQEEAKTAKNCKGAIKKKKRKRTMTVRQQRYKKFLLQGMSNYVAARKAGYSHNTAKNANHNFVEKRGLTMKQELQMRGLTDKKLAKHAEDGLEAQRIHGTSDDFVEIPDWNARHKYLETVLRLAGHGAKEQNGTVDQSQHIHLEVKLDDYRNLEPGDLIGKIRGFISQNAQGESSL